MPAKHQTVMFQKPAQYWQKRGEYYIQYGDNMRAAAMFRHAARIDPNDMEIRMGYARALRDLWCYEASNREAFAAAAIRPMSRAPYGLMSRNFKSLGMSKLALDTYNLYYGKGEFEDEADYDEYILDEEDALILERPKGRHQRLEGLIRRAIKRLGRLDVKGAKQALDRAMRIHRDEPYQGRYWALVMYHETAGNRLEALENARLLLMRPKIKLSPARMATLACALHRLGDCTTAKLVLMKVAAMPTSPSDELIVLLAAQQLNMLPVARGMLKRNLRYEPRRLPTCYNLAVCLLKLNDLSGASRSLHMCREIDPDDIPSEWLFAKLPEWEDEQVRMNNAKGLMFYQAISPVQLSEVQKPINEALLKGPEAFAAALQTDDKLYRRLLYVLSARPNELGRLLPDIVPHMQKDTATRLLREILFMECRSDQTKLLAVALLKSMGETAPIAVRRGDHVTRDDPEEGEQEHAGLFKRLLFRQIRRAVRFEARSALAPFGMELIRRMNKAHRHMLARDNTGMCVLALCLTYAKIHHTHTEAVYVDMPERNVQVANYLADEYDKLFFKKGEHHEAD